MTGDDVRVNLHKSLKIRFAGIVPVSLQSRSQCLRLACDWSLHIILVPVPRSSEFQEFCFWQSKHLHLLIEAHDVNNLPIITKISVVPCYCFLECTIILKLTNPVLKNRSRNNSNGWNWAWRWCTRNPFLPWHMQ